MPKWEHEPYELSDVAALRQWALNRVRGGRHQGERYLLIPNDRGGARLDGKEHGRAVSGELHRRLDAKWPRSTRTGGRTHLTACGVVDLVSDSLALRKEGERLARLDREEFGRECVLRDAAERVFDALEGVASARQRAREQHPPIYCTFDCCAPLCVAATSLRRRALSRAERWLDDACVGLDGARPMDLARSSEEELARALFHLEGLLDGVVRLMEARPAGRDA